MHILTRLWLVLLINLSAENCCSGINWGILYLQTSVCVHTSQVNMYLGPDEAGNALVGAGPRLEEAPHVECFFLPQPDGWQNGELTWLRPSHLNAELQCRCRPSHGLLRFTSSSASQP